MRSSLTLAVVCARLFFLFRAVFLLVADRPRCPATMAVMDQKDTYAVGWFLSAAPCIRQSLVSIRFLPEEYSTWFWETTRIRRIQRILVRQWIHIYASLRSLRLQLPYTQCLVLSGTCCASVTEFACCYDAPRAVFLPGVFRPQMQVIMAGMDQKERYVAPCRKLRIFRSCRSSQVVDFPVLVQRPFPMVLPVRKTMKTPQLQYFAWWSMFLLCRSCSMPVVVDKCPWFRSCRNSWRFRSRSSSGCGRRRDYAATSCLATVKVQQDSVHRWSQLTFQSPQRQVRTVAAVHGGLPPRRSVTPIRCIYWRVSTKTCGKSSVRTATTKLFDPRLLFCVCDLLSNLRCLMLNASAWPP